MIRLEPGGSSTVEESGLSIEHAKELATLMKSVGDPPGCCWCIGVDEEEEVDEQTH